MDTWGVTLGILWLEELAWIRSIHEIFLAGIDRDGMEQRERTAADPTAVGVPGRLVVNAIRQAATANSRWDRRFGGYRHDARDAFASGRRICA